MKSCRRCKKTKPTDDFYKMASSLDGHQAWCKTCSLEALRLRKSKREKMVSPGKEKECRRCHLVSPSDNFHRSKVMNDGLDSYCKGCRSEIGKRYYAKEKDHHHRICREWYVANKDRRADLSHKWRRDNPERIREHNRNRRALLQGATGRHSEQDIVWLMTRQGNRCDACRKSFKRAGYHVDHIIPLSRGGDNSRENLELLCKSCNSRKHTKTPEQWFTSLGRLTLTTQLEIR